MSVQKIQQALFWIINISTSERSQYLIVVIICLQQEYFTDGQEKEPNENIFVNLQQNEVLISKTNKFSSIISTFSTRSLNL